jgi:hypothetical protein
MADMSSLQMAMQLMQVETEGVDSLTDSEKQQLEKNGVRFGDTGHNLFSDNIEEYDGSSEDSNQDSEDECEFGSVINLDILNFGDKRVLKQLTPKQAKSLKKWLMKYRKSLRKFSKILTRFENFVELTSDKMHPYHNEGRYIQQFLDNKLTGWVDDDVEYFETYFTEEMPLFSAEMKFDHGRYVVPFCEYCDENSCACTPDFKVEEHISTVKRLEHFEKVDTEIRAAFDYLREKLVKFGVQAFKDDSLLFEEQRNKQSIMMMGWSMVMQGKLGERGAELKTETAMKRTKAFLTTCEENMCASKRFYLWMHGMRQKEAIVEKLMQGIIEKSEDVENGAVLSPFEKMMFDAYNASNDTSSPMDMSPVFMAWAEIPNYSPKDGEFEFNYYFKKLYPELVDAKVEAKMLAKKHVYQYHVRYDIFTPRMLVDYFHMDVAIERAKFDQLTRFINSSKYHVRKALKFLKESGKVQGKARFEELFYRLAYMSAEDFSIPDACTMCWGVDGLTLKKCGGCYKTVYCSQKCAKTGWVNHRETCSGGFSDSAPLLIGENGKAVEPERSERNYLCDPTKEYELFEQNKPSKPVEKPSGRSFKAPPVKNKYSGKKKGKKGKKK